MITKLAVLKLTPTPVRLSGAVGHYHGESRRICYCRAGIDAAFAQAQLSVPVEKREGK